MATMSPGAARDMIRRFLEPLGRRLILLFAIVLVVPSVFGIAEAISHYRGQEAAAYRSVARYTTLASNYETNLLWQANRIAESLQWEDAVRAAANGVRDARAIAECDNAFLRAVRPYPAYGTAILFDLSGNPICAWDRSKSLRAVGDRAWFQRVLETGASTLSERVMSRSLGEPIVAFGAPVKDRDGKLQAVIGFGLRLDWLNSIDQESGLPPESVVYLLDRHGTVLVAGHAPNGPDALPVGSDLATIVRGSERTFNGTGTDGVDRSYAVYSIGDGQLFTLLGLPREMLVGPLRRDLMIQIAVLCVVSIAGMVSAVVGSRLLVTRWTEKLTDAARSTNLSGFSAGDELRGAPVELRELGETLKRMAERIEAREAELQVSLNQKQLMLREIHHRVKNNLQMVTSLMNLYARLPRGDEFKSAFADVQLRVNALALVHRHLYESQDLQDIDFAPFMINLCSLLQDGSGLSSRQVRLIARIPELRLNGDRAVPLALLATEIITNSFKHAFPGGRTGSIIVEMTVDEAQNAVLKIVDDGVGSTPERAEAARASMGRALIDAFTKQLNGRISVSGPPGMSSVLRFSLLDGVTLSGMNTDRADVEAV